MNLTSLFLTLTTLLRFTSPSIEKSEWSRLDSQLKQKLAPLHFHLNQCRNSQDISILGNQCTTVIRDFLEDNKELFVEEDKPRSKTKQLMNSRNIRKY